MSTGRVDIYRKPCIVRRDPVALTAAAKILSITKPMSPAPCWVARAVYGEGNPR